MRVAVTGSSGLIGSALCPALAAAGHDVVRIVRRPAGAGEAHWDPVAATVDVAALAGVEAVVHLAGAGLGDRRWTAARRALLVRSRVEATALLAATLVRLDPLPAVLVSASAIGVYGARRGDEVLTEQSSLGDDFLADLCRQWEAAAQPVVEAGIRLVTPRTGIVLSARGGALGRQLPLFRLGLGGRLGDGRQWTSWVAREDVVRALQFALDTASLAGPVNVSAPEPVTNRAFTAELARAVRRPAVLAVPAWALAMALGRGLAEEAVLASQRVRPAALEAAGFTFAHPALPGALAAALSDRAPAPPPRS